MIIAVKERVIVHLIAIVYNETVDAWQAVGHECGQGGQAPPGQRESGRA